MKQCLSHLEREKETKIVALSFQAEKDLFSLSVMCSNLLKAVEAFAKRALEEMKRKHKVDDTWEARISDHSSIKTDMEGPLELPNRYLLWKACRMHLYTLENVRGGHVRCDGLGVLPDGERLVSMERDKIIRMWDLSTKNNHIIYDGGDETDLGRCFLYGEYIIATFGGSVHVLSLDGNPVYNVEAPDDEMHVASITTIQKKVFFRYFTRNEIISCLDLVTGVVQEHEAPWSEETNHENRYLQLGVCGSILLALDRDAGIHVIDVRNFSLTQFLAGYYTSMVEATGDTVLVKKEKASPGDCSWKRRKKRRPLATYLGSIERKGIPWSLFSGATKDMMPLRVDCSHEVMKSIIFSERWFAASRALG